jgi:hypothetical protein
LVADCLIGWSMFVVVLAMNLVASAAEILVDVL